MHPLQSQAQQIRFNSMKVRLKPETQIMKLNAEALFQFHEGPIKTRITLP